MSTITPAPPETAPEGRPPRTGEVCTIDITDLAFGGRGVGRQAGFVVFVEGALPGERVRARIRRVRKGHADAETVAVVRRSAERASPPCRHYGPCGGCDLQHMTPAGQAEAKRLQVAALLQRIAGLYAPAPAATITAGDPAGCRFHMTFAWGPDLSGRTVLGLHRRNRADRLLPIAACHVLPEDGQAVVRWLSEESPRRGLVERGGRRGGGLLRRAGLQMAAGTLEILVTLETGRGDPPALGALARDLVRRHPRVVGVVREEFDRQGRPVASSILAGRDHLFEIVGADRLQIPAGAFFQAHRGGNEALRDAALAALEPAPGETILELYAGVGFFTLPLARRAGGVVAVEGRRDAIAAARANAGRGGAGNVRFVCDDVALALPDLLARERFDAALVDPPRAGLGPGVAADLARSAVRRLVYVSCDPATLARDLKILVGGGYRLEAITPIDLFPHTHHVECVALLRKDGDGPERRGAPSDGVADPGGAQSRQAGRLEPEQG